MYKNGKWANSILISQDEDGLWGNFHSLSVPSKNQLSTEQALRRLDILGFTIDDKVIQKTVNFMDICIQRKKVMPDRREKSHNWDLFSDLMFAAWIKRFTNNCTSANSVADKWSKVISESFLSGCFSREIYNLTFEKVFKEPIKGNRFLDFVNFYHLSLLPGVLENDIESIFIHSVLNNRNGIYYVNNKCLNVLPEKIDSKETTKFLASIELVSRYSSSISVLGFVLEWLNNNAIGDTWDLGTQSKDFIYLPLSDSWRLKENRIMDCSYWIRKIITQIKSY